MAQRRCDWVVVQDDPQSPRGAAPFEAAATTPAVGDQPAPSPSAPTLDSPIRARNGPIDCGGRGAGALRGTRGSVRGQRGRGGVGQRGRGLQRRGQASLRSASSAASVLEIAGRGRGAYSPPLRPSLPLVGEAPATNAVGASPAIPEGGGAAQDKPSLQGHGVCSRSASDLPTFYRRPQPPGGRRLPPGAQKERSHSSPLQPSSTAPASPGRPQETSELSTERLPTVGRSQGDGPPHGRGMLRGIRGAGRGRGMGRGERQPLSPLAGRKPSAASSSLSIVDSPDIVGKEDDDTGQVLLPTGSVPSVQPLEQLEESVQPSHGASSPPAIVIVGCNDPQEPIGNDGHRAQPKQQRISGSPMASKRNVGDSHEVARSKSVDPSQRRGGRRGRGRGRGGGRGGLVFHRPANTRPATSATSQVRRRGAPPASAGRNLSRSATAPHRPQESLLAATQAPHLVCSSGKPQGQLSNDGLVQSISPRSPPRDVGLRAVAMDAAAKGGGCTAWHDNVASRSMPNVLRPPATEPVRDVPPLSEETELTPSRTLEPADLPLCMTPVDSVPVRKSASTSSLGVGVGMDFEEPSSERDEDSNSLSSPSDSAIEEEEDVEEEEEEEEEAPFIPDVTFVAEDEDAPPADMVDTNSLEEDHSADGDSDDKQNAVSPCPPVPSLPPARPARQLSQRAVGFVGKSLRILSVAEERAAAEKEKKKALHAERRKTAQLQQYEAELMAFADDVQRSLGGDTELPSETNEQRESLEESNFLNELLTLVGSNDRKLSITGEDLANIDSAHHMANKAAEETLEDGQALVSVDTSLSPPSSTSTSPVSHVGAPKRPARGRDIAIPAEEYNDGEELLAALDAAAEDVRSSEEAAAPTRKRRAAGRTRSIVISRKLGSIDVGTLSDEMSSTTDATSCGSLDDGSIFDMDEIDEGEEGEKIANDWRKSIRASRLLKAFRPPISRLRSPYFYSPKDGTPNALELRSWLQYRSQAEALAAKSERLDTCCIGLVKFVRSKELRDPLLPGSPQGIHNPFLSTPAETRAEDKMLGQQLQREHMQKPAKLAFLGVPSRVNHITLRLLRDHSESVHQLRQSVLNAFVDCGTRFMLILLRCTRKMGYSLMSSVKEALAKEVYNDFDGAQTPEFKMRCLVELWNSPAIKQAYSTLYGVHASTERKNEIPAISLMGDIAANGFETMEKDAMVLHLASVGRVHTHRLKICENDLDLVVFAELGDAQRRILPGITAAAILYLIDLASPTLWEEVLQFRRQFQECFRRKPTLVLLTGVSSFTRLTDKPQALSHALPLYQGEAVQSQLIAYIDKQFTDGLPKVCTVFCSSTSDPVIMRQISKHVGQFASNFLQKRAKARGEKEKSRTNEHLGAQLRVRNPGRKAGKTISRLSMRVKGLDVRSTFSRLPSGLDA